MRLIDATKLAEDLRLNFSLFGVRRNNSYQRGFKDALEFVYKAEEVNYRPKIIANKELRENRTEFCCSNCGAEVNLLNRFCSQCGANLDKVEMIENVD